MRQEDHPMTSITWPDHLLTIEEWDALPEDVCRRCELVDGVLQMSPSPISNHQVAMAFLCAQLNDALTARYLIAVPDVDVALVESFPPLLRSPDIVVVPLVDARTGPKRYRADQVRLAVEIISPGTARVDRVAKMAEYAEAGIPSYWIIDLDGEVSLDAFSLVDGAYRPSLAAATGQVTITEPAPVTIDLPALRP
jgi:Uma2 family endonuclease